MIRSGGLSPRRRTRDQICRRFERVCELRPEFTVTNPEDGDKDECHEVDSLVHDGL